jgi:adenine-specific DNA-methyltransferase
MVSSVINNGGSMRSKEFTRVDEYLFFVMFGESGPEQVALGKEWLGNVKNTTTEKLRWRELMRYGDSGKRSARPNLFYPIFVSQDGKRFVGVGKPLPMDKSLNDIDTPEGAVAVWPIRPNGEEGRWGYDGEGLVKLQKQGFVKLGNFTKNSMGITFIQPSWQKRIEKGEIRVIGYAEDGSIIESSEGYVPKYSPKTQWAITSHSASEYGTKLLSSLIGQRFAFPKSLYAVHDTLRFFVNSKPKALILDFFAGSGTTLQAVNLLNAADGGQRRCILVTNNEVSVEEAKTLSNHGYFPGDEEWERLGIARYVTWPRTVCSIKGEDINGTPLKGKYISDKDIPMADGFKANAIFFKLGFLNHNSVKLGRQFCELLPILWMKAGAIGPCPDMKSDNLPDWLILPENKFAVLIDDNQYHAFKQEMEKVGGIDTLYIITDFEREYTIMAEELGIRNTFQLYRDYLDNFRINHSR